MEYRDILAEIYQDVLSNMYNVIQYTSVQVDLAAEINCHNSIFTHYYKIQLTALADIYTNSSNYHPQEMEK